MLGFQSMKSFPSSSPRRANPKRRLDLLLVDRGLVPNRDQAGRLILAGQVKVNDVRVDKPGRSIDPHAVLELIQPKSQYVSRAGEKLAPALEAFSIRCTGRVVMDVGASTGGFTDCVLQHGASKVYAIDVGYGQLDWRLRSDHRVVVMDRFNIRNLRTSDLPELVDLVVIDVSFISLKLVLPVVLPVLKNSGHIIALIKPQFEVGKGQVGKGGVVRKAALRDQVRDDYLNFARSVPLEILGIQDSILMGKKGNKEMLLGLKKI